MNRMIMFTLSIILIVATTVLLYLSQETNSSFSTPNGAVTTTTDKTKTDNQNTSNDKNTDDNNKTNTVVSDIQNVYISASSVFNSIHQAGWNTTEKNVLQVTLKTSDALKLLNADRYSITIYLQGMASYMGGKYVLTTYDNDLTTHNANSSYTWLFYVLPDDFVLPQGDTQNLTYTYYALVEIKDNTTNEVITSNLISGDISCRYSNEVYFLTILDIELNSNKFTKSGTLPEVE